MDISDIEVVQFLGSGGYASVYQCRRKGRDDLLALKRISRDVLVTAQQKERLETEKQILFRPADETTFLCRGVAVFENEHDVALLMEFVHGRPLYQCVWGYRDTGRFPEAVAKFVAAQIVLALRELHSAGHIHRDLKTGNVLVDQRGVAKVIDFGLSKAISDESSRTHSLCGTPYIMAPEVARREPYCNTVDWWSLGVIIYEMVYGRPPWEYKCPSGRTLEQYFDQIAASVADNCLQRDSPSDITISADLDSLIKQLICINPQERLGAGEAAEVMQHPWFKDVDWDTITADRILRQEVVSPYDGDTDYNPRYGQERGCDKAAADAELSSAESIDPEDDAKYFGSF